MVTNAVLQERLETLKQQREQVVANANAITGAIQVLESLLAEDQTPAQQEAAKVLNFTEQR
jgi:ABC-type transporter Mla subunit MlaD